MCVHTYVCLPMCADVHASMYMHVFFLLFCFILGFPADIEGSLIRLSLLVSELGDLPVSASLALGLLACHKAQILPQGC